MLFCPAGSAPRWRSGRRARKRRKRGMTVDAVWTERAQQNPARRILDVQEVANVVSFLASAAASGVNGEAITVSIGSNW